MKASDDYGVCDICEVRLGARYWSFDRQVEQFVYDRVGDTPGECATVTVLHSEALGIFCCRDCAWLAALLGLAERGLKIVECGAGPIETCAKCNGPVDLTKPHALYQLMDQTESRQPWLITLQPIDTESLAYVCPRCDGDLAADEMNIPESASDLESVEMKVVASVESIEPFKKAEVHHDR